MIRASVLFGLVAALSGCNSEFLTFDDSDGASPDVSATDGSLASAPDATLDGEAAADGNPRVVTRVPPDADLTFTSVCRSDNDCSRYRLRCVLGEAGVGSCVACVTSSDCPDPQVCDPTINRCVQCYGSTCPSGEVCLGEPTHTCIRSCTTSAQCSGPNSTCDTTRNVCLDCTRDEQCYPLLCDPVSGRCAACVSNDDCPRRNFPQCDRTTSRCVECLHNSDCGRGVCVLGGICVGATELFDAHVSE